MIFNFCKLADLIKLKIQYKDLIAKINGEKKIAGKISIEYLHAND